MALYASLLGRLDYNKSADEANRLRSDNRHEQYNIQNTNIPPAKPNGFT